MGLKTCPKCNGIVSTSRDICVHCGYFFPATKACPECNETVSALMRECPSCGFLFDTIESDANRLMIHNSAKNNPTDIKFFFPAQEIDILSQGKYDKDISTVLTSPETVDTNEKKEDKPTGNGEAPFLSQKQNLHPSSVLTTTNDAAIADEVPNEEPSPIPIVQKMPVDDADLIVADLWVDDNSSITFPTESEDAENKCSTSVLEQKTIVSDEKEQSTVLSKKTDAFSDRNPDSVVSNKKWSPSLARSSGNTVKLVNAAEYVWDDHEVDWVTKQKEKQKKQTTDSSPIVPLPKRRPPLWAVLVVVIVCAEFFFLIARLTPCFMNRHVYGKYVVEIKATCTEDGSKYQKCLICGKKKTETLYAIGHTPGAWIVDSQATAFSSGVQHRVCVVCGKTIDTSITPPTGYSNAP